MHRKYIRKIYLRKLDPANSRETENEELKKLQEKFSEIYDELLALLPEDKQEKFDALCDTQMAMQSEIELDAFVIGFKIGANIIAESLYSEDD